MEPLTEEQQRQESLYDFPYHYIPHFEKGRFSQVRLLRWGYEYFSYVHFVLDRLDTLEFDSLLDVGCGDGGFLKQVRGHFDNKRLVGTDISQRAINYAKAFNPDIEFLTADISDGAIIAGRFEVVTCIDTLEHIRPEDLRSFVEGLARCLGEDGTLIVTVPSNNMRCSAKHYQHFDLESLSDVLGSDFAISESFYLNRKSWAVRLLHRCLTNNLFVLNARSVVDWIFRYYRRRFLIACASDGTRICAICKKRTDT